MKNFLALLFIIIFCSCQSIRNSLAFHPDTENTIPVGQLPNGVQEIFIESGDDVKLQSYFIANKQSKRLLIYFHGNAGNISHRLKDLIQLKHLGVNVLGVSYRGYGKSTGKVSEEGIYEDGTSTLEYAVQKLGFPLSEIYILGRSIGSTVAINTSQHKSLAGLILVTPLSSGSEQAKAMGLGSVSSLAGNSFNNMSKVKNIKCPTLIIHGTNDRVIPFFMGQEIYQNLNTLKTFVSIKDAGHNNLSTDYSRQYWLAIYNFILKTK